MFPPQNLGLRPWAPHLAALAPGRLGRPGCGRPADSRFPISSLAEGRKACMRAQRTWALGLVHATAWEWGQCLRRVGGGGRCVTVRCVRDGAAGTRQSLQGCRRGGRAGARLGCWVAASGRWRRAEGGLRAVGGGAGGGRCGLTADRSLGHWGLAGARFSRPLPRRVRTPSACPVN